MAAQPATLDDDVVGLPLRRFSNDDYLAMIEAGVFGPSDKVELINGMIVDTAPAGSDHHHSLSQLTRLFASAFNQVTPSIQGTLIIAEGQVYDPDFMLLRPRPGGYKQALPRGADVLLLIEASESSLRRDRQVKLPVYARAGIADYWIADVKREVLTVHRQPHEQGYARVEAFHGDDTIAPLALPELTIRAGDIFD